MDMRLNQLNITSNAMIHCVIAPSSAASADPPGIRAISAKLIQIFQSWIQLCVCLIAFLIYYVI